jgi:CMP-N-acetylneuraminic acid synthetase
MKNVAIITAKGQSQSIPRKNIMPITGFPCVTYALAAAAAADRVDGVFCLTDSNIIAALAGEYGAQTIWEPEVLTAPDVNHGDAIAFAVRKVKEQHKALENVVIMIGNGVMIGAPLVDRALEMLEDDPTLDSVMSVWQAQDDHPLRSLAIGENGLLTVYPGREHLAGASPEQSTNRQSYPLAYYFDQGLWAFRAGCAGHKDNTVSPWWWMGEKCRPIVRTWLAGRDIHNLLDASAAEWWLKEGHKYG